MLLRLLRFRQLEPGGSGLVCGAYTAVRVRAGNSWSGLVGLGWEVTVKVYGVAVTMPRGQSRVPHSSTGHQ